jgi:hypothetical protein
MSKRKAKRDDRPRMDALPISTRERLSVSPNVT